MNSSMDNSVGGAGSDPSRLYTPDRLHVDSSMDNSVGGVGSYPSPVGFEQRQCGGDDT